MTADDLRLFQALPQEDITYCPNCGSINIFYDKTIGLMHCYICDLDVRLLKGSHHEPGDDDDV
jgi:hypothetical protein